MTVLNCANVPIPNQEWCGDMGSLGATCFKTLTPDKRDIPKTQWDNERIGEVCTTLDNFGQVKAIIEKLCNDTQLCTYEQKILLENFFINIQKVQAQSKAQADH